MAQSKTDKSRKENVEAFKEKAKEKAQQEATPKTQLFPTTQWETTDILRFRGDLLEGLEHLLSSLASHINGANEDFGKVAQVMQMIAKDNIDAGTMKLQYKWNNGESATEEEVAKFQKTMAEVNEQRQKQFEEQKAQWDAFQKAQENAKKTGLVGLDGEPIGTDQDLDTITEVDFEDDQYDDEKAEATPYDENTEGRV